MKEKKMKPIAFRIDESLIQEFRDVVKKSGYKQSHLVTEALKRIIEELKNEKK